MGLSKEERSKVSEQLTKIATFLERKKKEAHGEDENLTPYEIFRKLQASRRKIADLPDPIQMALLEAPTGEISQAQKDIGKVEREVNFMMPALERLDTRLRDKLKLPANSSHLKALDDLAKSLVQVSTKLEELGQISEVGREVKKEEKEEKKED